MNRFLETKLELLINYLIVAITLILPLFFLPTTFEFFEFNKQWFLVVGALVLLVVWSIKMVVGGKVVIKQAPTHLFFLAFLIAFTLSTVFSADKFASLAGSYLRFNNGLVTILAVAVIYLVTITNIRQSEQVVKILAILVISTALSGLLSILNYFNIVVFQTSWGRSPSFTPLGNFENLAFLEILVLPLAIGLALRAKEYWMQISSVLASLIIGISLIFINLTAAWFVLALMFLIFFFTANKLAINKKQKALLIFIASVFAITLVVANVKPLSTRILAPLAGQKEVSQLPKSPTLPAAFGWATATGVLGSSPLRAVFGLGPATFGLAYTQFRPVEVNNTTIWDLRFDKSSSEILEMLANLGILGIVTYLLFLASIGKIVANYLGREEKIEPVPFFAALAVSAFIIGSFFLSGSAAVYFAFYLTLALLLGLLAPAYPTKIFDVQLEIVALKAGALRFIPATSQQHSPSTPSHLSSINLLSYAFLLISTALALFVGYTSFRAYKAEAASLQAAVLINQGQSLESIRKASVNAVMANPYRDVYHRNLAIIDLEIVKVLSNQPNLEEQDKNNLSLLIQEAIAQGKIITGYQNPPLPGQSTLNVANWETLGSVYANLATAVKDFHPHAINVANKIVQLDKFNPKSWISLGQVLQLTNDLDGAIKAFETAVSLKPDFANAHYNLAQALKAKGGSDERVVAELQAVLKLIPENDPNRESIQKEHDELKAKLPPKPSEQPATPTPSPTPPQATQPASF